MSMKCSFCDKEAIGMMVIPAYNKYPVTFPCKFHYDETVKLVKEVVDGARRKLDNPSKYI